MYNILMKKIDARKLPQALQEEKHGQAMALRKKDQVTAGYWDNASQFITFGAAP